MLRNGFRVLSDPRMLSAYLRWQAAGGAKHPGAALAREWGTLTGFESFSEYWGVLNGLPSRAECRLVDRCLGEGRVALDVGANLGQFALLMSATGATVHSFEPFPETFARLERNVLASARADRVRRHALAVSDTHGTAYMEMTNSAATNRLSTGQVGCAVQCTTLDSFCAGHGIKEVHLLKVDVEGAEPLVFRGASRLLSRSAVRGILVEMCPGNLQRLGFSVADLLGALEPHGYSLHRLGDDGGPAGMPLTQADLEDMVLENVLAIPRVDGGSA